MTRRNEFDWRKHLDRMLKRISNNPDKKVVVKKNNPIQVKISEQRLELIRYLRARYPNKHPLELAEIFTRYFNMYGTYKPPTKQKKTMDIPKAKARIKKEMKAMGLPLTKLEEVTPYTKSTISSMLAPSGDPAPSFIREVFSGVDKLKSSSEADNMKKKVKKYMEEERKDTIRSKMRSMRRPLTDLSEVTSYPKSTISTGLAPLGTPSSDFLTAMEEGVKKLQDQEKQEMIDKADENVKDSKPIVPQSVADNMKQMEEQFGNKREGSEEDIDIDKDISSDISDGIVYKFKKGERALSKFSGVPIHYINLHRSNMLVRLTNGWELYVYIKVDDDGNPYLGVSKKSVEEVQ